MHIISRRRLLEAAAKHSGLYAPLDAWYRLTKKAKWKTLVDTKRELPTADLVGALTVFNIKGNTYRLVVAIHYNTQMIYIRDVLTHAEYDRGGWK